MDNDVTELEEFDTKKVSGVGTPANATPWLMLKAADLSAEELESQAFMALTTLHDYALKGTCAENELEAVQNFVDSIDPTILEKAKLNAKRRNALPNSMFAYIDSKGGRHLPIEDASHVRDALARLNQTHFDHPSDEAKAKAKIDARAKELGIEVAKSPGVPDYSTEIPSSIEVERSESSTQGVPMTAGVKRPPKPADSLGGESTYKIPLEINIKNPRARAMFDKPKKVKIKDGVHKTSNWMEQDNPPANHSADDHEEIVQATKSAFSRLNATYTDEDVSNFVQAIQGFVAKRLSLSDSATQAEEGLTISQEGDTMTTISKEQLTAEIAKASQLGFAQALKADRKAVAKAEKKARKKAMKDNPNNGGNVTPAQMEADITGKTKADKINLDKIKKNLRKSAAELDRSIAKLAATALAGGPVLDGQARGAYLALEGRQSESVTKSEIDLNIERLEKSLGDGPKDPMIQDQLSRELTLAKLTKAHLEGLI